GGVGRAVLSRFTSTAGSRLRLSCDGLKKLDGLRLAQRLQRDPLDLQVAAQIGEISGELRVEFPPLTSYRAQQQLPAAMPLPVPSQVAQQVEGGLIDPLQVIQQEHQWRMLCQGVLSGSRQIRVAYPQLGHETRQFG